ncbi:hypothetical protein [Comamonas thiooxydans]|uniref:hypothetical protein n=1 Tax=Comamonas thiooxydans TaxID=363952 RepID=UPI00050F2D19|nr:hypothetical protein [Comamonas thiooxydans]KGG88638.1 hypothetical protein P369_17535 [Comamonas thiooxydans]KGG99545.1 hypothetical protein P367_10530 [Comamonas thiooxydans]KGH03978.1 hypothetical protein P365_16435 [Comamonas thiooxydans]KGH11346.1 hypothetical protein P368_15095 [Comamonas thiooxydans]TZG12388.1 hypothetical protein FZC30_01820 [Comamonas thiooxydans]
MTLFVCTQIEAPCQLGNQVAITEITVQDFAALGITPASIGTSVALGFGLVFFLAMLGFGLGVVLQMIRRYL